LIFFYFFFISDEDNSTSNASTSTLLLTPTPTLLNKNITNSSLSSFQSGNTNNYNIERFMIRTPTKSEESILEDHLLRITVSNGFAFKWIESEEVKSLFRWLNPNIRLPNRKALSGRILDNATLKHNNWMEEQASNSEHGVTIALDSWSNVVNEKILGVVLITNEGETLVWNAYDISGERSRT